MLGTHDLELFIISCITLNLIPGSDTIYILTRSLSEGKKSGIVSALGISTGSVFHIFAAAFGLSAIILSSTYGFTFIKVLGSLYLCYLGIKMFIKKEKKLDISKSKVLEIDLLSTYKQAILTNVLNPKVALFFMALLPQFVLENTDYKMFSFLFLGSIFLLTGTLWCLILAIFASAISNRIKSKSNISKLLPKITGGIFIFLGIKLFMQKA